MKTKKLCVIVSLLTLAMVASCGDDDSVLNQEDETAKKVTLGASSHTENGFAFVDLDLPSGLKWATCNVGAENPWDNGEYFAWGETAPKTNYNWSTYKYGSSEKDLTKYNYNSDYGMVDNIYTLEPADDAAHTYMGGKWRMPITAEMDELLDNCYWEWTNSYNNTKVAGYIVYKAKSDADKGKRKRPSSTAVSTYTLADVHIFLPLSGHYEGEKLGLKDTEGFCWTASLNESEEYPCPCWSNYIFFGSFVGSGGIDRSFGLPVRAVCQ